MNRQELITKLLNYDFGKDIILERNERDYYITIKVKNKKTSKYLFVGFHEDSFFIDEYDGEFYYEYTQEGLDDCIKQIKREIEFSADIYGFNKNNEKCYYNKICNDNLSTNILTQWCEIALEHDNQLKRIEASSYKGDINLEFIVENGELKLLESSKIFIREVIYEQYAQYFIDKFNKRLYPRLLKLSDDNILVDISSIDLAKFGYKAQFYKNGIIFSSVDFQEGLEFDDIHTINPQEVYLFIDEAYKKIQKNIDENYYLIYYYGDDEVSSKSINKNCITSKNGKIDISKFPKIENQTYDKIIVMNFYGDVLYEEKVKSFNQ